jgi:uncharacterized protein (TIGR03085 family)
MPWVDAERQALAETFRAADPDAPTLCEGWTTRHLLAHLVQRDQDQIGQIGDRFGRAAPGQERFMGRLVERARSQPGYEALLTRFLDGPARWSPMSWAADSLNLLEYVIHHEDVRRAGDDPQEPRALPAAETQSIWRRVAGLARLSYLRSPVGVTLATTGGPRRVVKKGSTGIVLTGDPVELALYLSGRRTAADVEVSGPPEAVARFTSWVSTT